MVNENGCMVLKMAVYLTSPFEMYILNLIFS